MNRIQKNKMFKFQYLWKISKDSFLVATNRQIFQINYQSIEIKVSELGIYLGRRTTITSRTVFILESGEITGIDGPHAVVVIKLPTLAEGGATDFIQILNWEKNNI